MSGNNDSIVLEEEIDPNYVPTEEEVVEYAMWMGMDMEADRDLFWIAREGLMAPLPTNWKPCKSADTGEIYYFNFETAESTWDHPCDGYYKRLYEEEKKKKETTKKAESDTVRTKARQDVDQLLGKNGKKKVKPASKEPVKQKSDAAPTGPTIAAAAIDKKALPGIRGKSPLPDSIPLRTTQSRDSTPERGRGEKKYSSATSSRPASADAKLGGGGGRALASLSSVPLPATVPAVAGDPPSSPEFTDSDVSPVKSESKGAVERSDEKNYGAKAERKSKNSRIHSAVASSSDFGRPELKVKVLSTAAGNVISDGGLKPKTVLGKIGSSLPPPSADMIDNPSGVQVALHGTNRNAMQAEGVLSFHPNHDQCQVEIDELTTANCSIKAEVDNLTVEFEKEKKKNEALSTSQNLLQTQLSTAREENRNMRSELNREIERRARIESELKETNTQCANAKKENSAHILTIQDLRAQIHNLEGELNFAKNSAASIDPPAYSPTGNHSLVDHNADLVSTLESNLKTQQTRVLQLETLVGQLQTGGEQKDAAVTDDIATLKESLERLSETKDIALHEAQVKGRRVAELEQSLSAAQESARLHQRAAAGTGESQEQAELKIQVETLSRNMSQITAEHTNTQRSFEELQFKARRLESQLQIRQSDLKDTESRLSLLKRKVADLQDQCDSLEIHNKSLSSRLSSETEEKARVEAALLSSKEDVNSLQTQVASLERADLATDRDSGRLEVNALKRKYDTLQADFSELELKMTRKDQEIAQCKCELETQVEITERLRLESSRARNSGTVEVSEALKLHEQELLEKMKAASLRESSLQADIASLQGKCTALQEEVLISRREVERLCDKKCMGESTKSRLDELVVDLEQKNSSLHRELTDVTLKEGLKVQALELELERCRAELVESRKLQSTELSPGEVDKRCETCSNLTVESEILRKENYTLNSELKVSNTRLKDVEHELRAARSEREQLCFENARSQGVHLETLNAKLESALEDRMKEKAELMQSQLTIDQLNRKIDSLEGELSTLRRDVVASNDSKAKLQEFLGTAEAALAENKIKWHSLEEENRVLKENSSSSRQEIAESTSLIRERDQHIYSLELDKKRLCEALEVASLEGRKAGGSAAAVSDNWTATNIQLSLQRENEIRRLQSDVRKLTAERDALKAQLDAKSVECLSRIETIQDLRKQIELLSNAPVKNDQSLATDKLKDDARHFFDSLLDVYKSKMEVTMREQLEYIAREKDSVTARTAATAAESLSPELASKKVLPGDPEKSKNADANVTKELRVSAKNAWGDEDDAPINILRDMLRGYMKNSSFSPQDDKIFLHNGRDGADSDIELFRKSVGREWQLVQEVKMFLRNENDIVRRKQQELSKDREQWRRQYQQTIDNRYSKDNSRAAKKLAGEQLNRRAEKLNDMVHQLREIQRWVSLRDEKLSRLDSMMRSACSVQSYKWPENRSEQNHAGGASDGEEAVLNHMHALRQMKTELDDDISLLSLQKTDIFSEPLSMLPPKRAVSPDRFLASGNAAWYQENPTMRERETLSEANSPSRQSKCGNAMRTAAVPAASTTFSTRLGTNSVTRKNEISGYSNVMRSSLNAYDLHADWLGHLKKEVSSYGSGSTLRRSHNGPLGLKESSVENVLLHNSASNRDTKSVADFLSHTRHVFSGPMKDSYDENSKPSSAGRPVQNVHSAPSVRRSIDNGDLGKGKSGPGVPSVYRI